MSKPKAKAAKVTKQKIKVRDMEPKKGLSAAVVGARGSNKPTGSGSAGD